MMPSPSCPVWNFFSLLKISVAALPARLSKPGPLPLVPWHWKQLDASSRPGGVIVLWAVAMPADKSVAVTSARARGREGFIVCLSWWGAAARGSPGRGRVRPEAVVGGQAEAQVKTNNALRL